MIQIYLIYITNLYRRKIFTFFLSKDEILVKKTPTSLHEKKTVCRQWTLILIFCVDVQMGLAPLPPSTCVHLSLTPPPPCGRHKWMAPNNTNNAHTNNSITNLLCPQIHPP